MIKKDIPKFYILIASFAFLLTFAIGLLGLFRANLDVSKMRIIEGRVVEKKINYIQLRGRTYFLEFRLQDKEERIAINLGSKNHANKDSAFFLIYTDVNYKFYLDPTVPTTRGVNPGIRRIDFGTKKIYQTSNKSDLYGGGSLCILGLVFLFLIYFNRHKIK